MVTPGSQATDSKPHGKSISHIRPRRRAHLQAESTLQGHCLTTKGIHTFCKCIFRKQARSQVSNQEAKRKEESKRRKYLTHPMGYFLRTVGVTH